MRMINLILSFSFLLSLGCVSSNKIDYKVKDVKTYDAKTFYETTSVWNSVLSHNENSVYFSSDKSGIYNVYKVPFAGGEFKQLTHSKKDAAYVITTFPLDDRFLYSSDSEGNERSHVYVMLKNGKTKDLTPGKKTKAHFFKWHKNNKEFYVMSNRRNPKYFDLYKYDTKNFKKTMVYKNTEGYSLNNISQDGRWLALHKTNDNQDSDIFIVDLNSKDKKAQHITKHKGKVDYEVFTFTPDSNQIIYGTNEFGEFSQAWSYDLQTKEHKLYHKADWDISYVNFSENGKLRVIATNNDAQTKISLKDMQTGKDLELPDLDGNVVRTVISKSEKKLVLTVNGDTSPSDLYSYDMTTKTLNRITKNLSPKIDQQDLVQSQVVRYKSFDGLEIPALLYKPWPSSENKKSPAVVWVHGGPGGQSRKGYNPMIQHLVNNGYTVLSVNNRGSSGYGKTFYHLDDKKHGQDDLQDCVWGRKYLESLPFVDKNNIAIMGGSYGGYMTAAALTFTPKAFDAGVNIFGVTNWVRTIESIPAWWASFRDYLITEIGDPKTEREALIAKSPLFHADKIEKPFLVVQGANDPRVLQVESDEIVAAAKKNNVPVEYVLFKDEGHGFSKKKNRITASEAYLKFFDTHLKSKKAL